MPSINWPWKPPPVSDGVGTAPDALPSYTMTPQAAAVLFPRIGMPVTDPAEPLWDPNHTDELAFAFDDTRPEGFLFEFPGPYTDASGYRFHMAIRARTAPSVDAGVVFRTGYRPRGSNTGWVTATLPSVTIPAGSATWIDVDLGVSPATFPVPKATHGWLLFWRDPTDAADDLVGDVHVGRLVIDVFA